jgi:ComF family protein
LYPNRCVFCGEELENPEADCCQLCYNKVDIIKSNYCKKCGKLHGDLGFYCFDCSKGDHNFVSGRAMLVYNSFVKKSLFGLKFFNQTWIGKVYGRWLAEYYADSDLPIVDFIIPVPLHYTRYLKRGYNQAELLAKTFCDETGIKLLPKGLQRKGHTKAQKDLSNKQRQVNMIHAFRVNVRYKKLLEGKRVLLIDDIYTTGATIDTCAGELLQSGAKEVFFLTVAIGNGL